jgi:type IV pilus assembly protein PilB
MKGLITLEEFQKAIEEQRVNGGRLESIFVRLGLINEENLLTFLCNHYMVPFLRLSQFEIKPNVIQLIPSNLARRHLLIPIHRVRDRLALAMVDPSDVDAIYDVWRLTRLNIETFGASETEIINAINKYYAEEGDVAEEKTAIFNSMDKNAEINPIV